MNVSLSWLSQYVKLPKDIKTLTDRLTSVGHMLDKTTKVGADTVIDLELRGNRADMFGLWGIAREVAAIAQTPLKLPQAPSLPKTDPKSPLVNVQPSAVGLVTRYTAIQLSVKVGPSPKWIVDHLAAYGIPAVNNVVDITNYVMVETSHPLHAFDCDKLKGGQLILRRAKAGEKFATVQQGTTLTLSEEDLAICDQTSVQCLSIIGGWESKVTDQTSHIILESAVYNPAGSRRTARRLKTITEGGSRHEKHQDPNGVPQSVARAVSLLAELATAKVESLTSDYYPKPVRPKTIKFDPLEVDRLTGLKIPTAKVKAILTRLGFGLSGNLVTVPTFRTDIEGPADLVEEVIRLYGYDNIPRIPLADATPQPQTYPSYSLQEKIRDLCLQLGLNEVVTLTMVSKEDVQLDAKAIAVVNPPDPTLNYLRTAIVPSLVKYATRLTNLRQNRVALFEVGKTFSQKGNTHLEHLRIGIAIAGQDQNSNWASKSQNVTFYHLSGLLQTLASLVGVTSLPVRVGENQGVFFAEIDLDQLGKDMPAFTNPYQVISQFPPIIEDVNLALNSTYAELITRLKKLSPFIIDIELIDKYDNKLTLRITYHSASKQLSSADVAPVREKIMAMGMG